MITEFFNCPVIECDICATSWPCEDLDSGAREAIADGWQIDPETAYALCDECVECGYQQPTDQEPKPNTGELERCASCGRVKDAPGCSGDETECECCWCYRDGRGA